jgi:DNA mismatch endonuclease (patch repair protein)
VTDIFTPGKRSAIMSRIRSCGTVPEASLYECVRQVLGHSRRVDKNVRVLPGKPDCVVPSLRLAIFVDGCFYHSCPLHGHTPKSNKAYWKPKLQRNRRRDRINRRELRKMGFAVWSFWEHDLKKRELGNLTSRLRRRLNKLVLERKR